MADTHASSLAAKRIVITRAAAQSESLARELAGRGAIPIVLPLVSFAEPEDSAPLDRAIKGISHFDWLILTSAQAVRAVAHRARQLEQTIVRAGTPLRVACVGPVTAEEARNAGFPVVHVAATHNGVALAEELGSRLAGKKVLLPRSDRANPDLPTALKRFGAEVTEVIAYRTVKPAEVDFKTSEEIRFGEWHAVLFFSPSAVKFSAQLFAMRWSELQDKVAITAVGPVTAKALREAGFTRIVVAENTSATSVIEALEKHFSGMEKTAPAGVKLG